MGQDVRTESEQEIEECGEADPEVVEFFMNRNLANAM